MMKRDITLLEWIVFLMMMCLVSMAVGVRASYGQHTAEQTINTASGFQSWEDELRQREQLVSERNAQQHSANQQAADALHERIQQHNLAVQQREHDLHTAYQQQFQERQAAAAQQETALKAQLKAQQEEAALQQLHQGMQMQSLLEQVQQPQQGSSIPDPAYGYADKTVPREQTQAARMMAPPMPIPIQAQYPATTILVLQQPTPIQTVAPILTTIKTTINGIDRIETKASLPSTLGVEQLEAVKQIADNGVIIAQQRLGLAQGDITSKTTLGSLSTWKSFLLWGLVVSIPFLITVFWIAKQVAVGWHTWQQDKFDYKLKELASAERQIAMSNKAFQSSQKRR